jgi:hypothetical protein
MKISEWKTWETSLFDCNGWTFFVTYIGGDKKESPTQQGVSV